MSIPNKLIVQNKVTVSAGKTQVIQQGDLPSGSYLLGINFSVSKLIIGRKGGKFSLTITDNQAQKMYDIQDHHFHSGKQKTAKFITSFEVLQIQEPACITFSFSNQMKFKDGTYEYSLSHSLMSDIDCIHVEEASATSSSSDPKHPRLNRAQRRFGQTAHAFSHAIGTVIPKSVKDLSNLIHPPDYRNASVFYSDLLNKDQIGTVNEKKQEENATASTWSHVAMIVKDPPAEVKTAYNIPTTETETVFVYESDTETDDFKQGGGVQLITLKKWIANCQEENGPDFLAVWRKLNLFKPDPEMFTILFKVMVLYKDSIYNWHYKELIKSKFKKNELKDISEGEIFCSELVGLCYRAMGILPEGIVPDNLVPRDFSTEFYTHRGWGRWEDKQDLPLLNASLEKEIKII